MTARAKQPYSHSQILVFFGLILAFFVFSTHSIAATQLSKTQFLQDLNALKKDLKTDLEKSKILSQLIFYVDSHYQGGSDSKFLADACRLIAKREVQNPQNLNAKVWRYYTDLQSIFERSEKNPARASSLLKSYFEYSDVENPKSPEKFVTEADYSNDRDYLNIN